MKNMKRMKTSVIKHHLISNSSVERSVSKKTGIICRLPAPGGEEGLQDEPPLLVAAHRPRRVGAVEWLLQEDPGAGGQQEGKEHQELG